MSGNTQFSNDVIMYDNVIEPYLPALLMRSIQTVKQQECYSVCGNSALLIKYTHFSAKSYLNVHNYDDLTSTLAAFAGMITDLKRTFKS